MNELIQLAERQIGDGTIQTVNARDLHTFLEVGKDFSTWVNDRIQKYGFVENQDFVCSPISRSKNLDGRGESHTYTRTLVTGKGLAYIQKRFHGGAGTR